MLIPFRPLNVSLVKLLPRYLGRFSAASLLIVWTVTACLPRKLEPSLTVAAAASLTNAFKEISQAFNALSGINVTTTFAATGQLAQQMRNGAPFDIIAAADAIHIDQLIDEGFLDPNSRREFADGDLVLVISPSLEEEIHSLDDLSVLEINRLVIANPEHAPYGLAAKQTLQSLQLWQDLAETIVYTENVRQAALVVATDNASLGLIAKSSALDSSLNFIEVDKSLHDPILHVAAKSRTSSQNSDADQFLEFLSSPQGIEILKKHGFAPLEGQ
ncbi:MAG: molybdate ABC transporter substrate-binding protein [Anaerolineales bacterium]|nr:molybdate ABC transporter substrate-binding protein [Anaerolineales bacterium]